MGLWKPWSLRELATDLNAGRTTPEAALARSQERVAKTEPEIEAWVSYDASPAGRPPGPLSGVPFGVKDIIDVAGCPTKLGAALHADVPPSSTDAAIVAAWRAAGAVPVGKTVTAEYAFFSPGPTRNPADPAYTPGSSSSGSAAAVAAGQVPLAIGTQTGGSTTRPASYCGIASLAMAAGRFPGRGVFAMSPSLDSHGVFTATVSDLALAWSALTGAADAGARDTGTAHSGTGDSGMGPARPPRLLLWTGEPLGVVSAAMAAAAGHAAEALRAAGAAVDPFPYERLAADLAGASAVVLRYEIRTERAAELAIAEQLGERWTRLRDESLATTLADYESAQQVVSAARAEISATLSEYDAIIGPGATGAAPKGLEVTGDPVMSVPWQTLRMPAVGVPGLRDDGGLPLGLQVIGRDEASAIRAGLWVEKQLGSCPIAQIREAPTGCR